MTEIVDVARNSLPASETLALEGVHESSAGIVIRVRSTATPACPACGGSVVSYHSRYERRIRDLPWQGRPVQLHLRMRRFRCRNQHCRQTIFAERLSALGAAIKKLTKPNNCIQPTRNLVPFRACIAKRFAIGSCVPSQPVATLRRVGRKGMDP